jgi:hypothetical protein
MFSIAGVSLTSSEPEVAGDKGDADADAAPPPAIFETGVRSGD